MNLTNKVILVTGGVGFLGHHLREALLKREPAVIHNIRSRDCDLTQADRARRYIEALKPDLVIHAAARVGGILANKREPYAMGRDNMLMGINVIDACAEFGVQKLVVVGSCCSYPLKVKTFPMVEDELHDGNPEPTNASYALAKRFVATLLEAAVKEGRLKCAAMPLLANLYGKYDSFDLHASHTIPALIRRYCHAVDTEATDVTNWGSGEATRDFLHARDAAEGIARVCEAWDHPDPINLGTGVETRIKDLAALIAELTGFTGRSHWQPHDGLDGQPHRALNCDRAWNALAWKDSIPLREGLIDTIQWWRDGAKMLLPPEDE